MTNQIFNLQKHSIQPYVFKPLGRMAYIEFSIIENIKGSIFKVHQFSKKKIRFIDYLVHFRFVDFSIAKSFGVHENFQFL
jgi:hypothetical protein